MTVPSMKLAIRTLLLAGLLPALTFLTQCKTSSVHGGKER